MGHGAELTVGALCRVPRLRPRAIIRVLPSVIEQLEQEQLFRVYVAESVRLMAQDKYLTASYYDLIKPKRKADKRSAQEIVDDIVEKAGLTLL